MSPGSMSDTALDTYWKVADLVQKGKNEEARALALEIPFAFLRGLALFLVNHSQRLTGDLTHVDQVSVVDPIYHV
jgi:hypothetical protein